MTHLRTSARSTGAAAALVLTACALAGAGPASAATATAASTTPASTTGGCATGALPVAVVGDPGVRAGQPLGIYVFHTGGHYSMRVTHPGTSTVGFSGVITTSRVLGGLHGVALERQDTVRRGADGRSLSFHLVNHGRVDGFDFTANCSRAVHLVLRVGRDRAVPNQVFLGAHRTSPTQVPFTIERATTTAARIS